jgi:hypothetical protein
LLAAAALLLGFDAVAQTTVAFTSVGAPMVILDPAGGTAGQSALFGLFKPVTLVPASITFVLSGVPDGYNGNPSPESVWFVLDIGNALAPGTGQPLLGGELLIPNNVPQTFLAGDSIYLGPADVVPAGGSSGGVQSGIRQGRRLDLSGLFSPAAIGVNLVIQAALVDSALNAAFTSNAIDFQVQ